MTGDTSARHTTPPPRPTSWRSRPSTPALVSAGLLYALAASLLLTSARLAEGRWAAFLAVMLIGASALARLIDRAARAPSAESPRGTSVAGVAMSVVAWILLIPILRALWLALDVPVTLFGDWERLLLAPLLALALLALGRRLRLHRLVTALAVIVSVVALFSETAASDHPMELVAAAGPADLAAALRDDATIALRTARHDRHAPVAPIPKRAGMRCQRIEVRDQRRTLIGMPAGHTEITSDTCWLRDGTPFAVRVIASTDEEDTTATPQAVQVLGTDPFRIGQGEADPIAAATPSARTGDAGNVNIHPFEDDGRVRLRGERDQPVLARVGRKGRQVEIVLGWLRADPLLRDSSSALEQRSSGGPATRFVEYGNSPRRNEELDVFAVTGAFAGGPDARFMRVRADGEQRYAALSRDQGRRPVSGGERALVTLQGGR